jgi:hypothetical protein
VVDFSLMTDQQVLAYISKASGGICGRFAEPQLNREMVIKKGRKLTWFKYVMHVIIPALLVMNRSSAQQSKIVGDTIVCATPILKSEHEVIRVRVGGISVSPKTKHSPVIIDGKVTDEKGEAVGGATIRIKGIGQGTSTDAHGLFKLKMPDTNKVTLIASCVGFAMKEMHVDLNTTITDTFKIEMSMNYITMGDVYVVEKKRIKTDTLRLLKNTIDDIIYKETVKVYPNPVHAGSVFNIDFDVKDAGEYMIDIVNISGQPVLQKKIILGAKKHIEQITCESHMISGVYVVQVVNTANKKVYTNKILVQ